MVLFLADAVLRSASAVFINQDDNTAPRKRGRKDFKT
jgi:hypothetical protein